MCEDRAHLDATSSTEDRSHRGEDCAPSTTSMASIAGGLGALNSWELRLHREWQLLPWWIMVWEKAKEPGKEVAKLGGQVRTRDTKQHQGPSPGRRFNGGLAEENAAHSLVTSSFADLQSSYYSETGAGCWVGDYKNVCANIFHLRVLLRSNLSKRSKKH